MCSVYALSSFDSPWLLPPKAPLFFVFLFLLLIRRTRYRRLGRKFSLCLEYGKRKKILFFFYCYNLLKVINYYRYTNLWIYIFCSFIFSRKKCVFFIELFKPIVFVQNNKVVEWNLNWLCKKSNSVLFALWIDYIG